MIGLDTAAVFGASAGGGMGLVFVVVRWTATFIAGRLDVREAKIDASTIRLIEGLEKRLDEETRSRIEATERTREVEAELRAELAEVRRELNECRTKHADAEARVKHLEATIQGLGDARQQAQVIIAKEKQQSK